MTVISSVLWQPKPGREQEFLQLGAQARAVFTRAGGRVRLWRSTAAGPSTGRYQNVVVYDSFAAWDRAQEALTTDPEAVALRERAFAADSPATSLGTAIFTNLPEFDTPMPGAPGGPRVRFLRQFTAEKGRQDEVRQLLKESRDHMIRLGALHFRVAQGIAAGPGPAMLAAFTEYADRSAYAATLDRATADEALGAFFRTRLFAAGSPLTAVGTSLQVEVS